MTLATTASYLELFDENGLDPEPASTTADGDRVIWEIDPPDAAVLSVSFDARIEPGHIGVTPGAPSCWRTAGRWSACATGPW